jgi:hypothetical protein
LGVIRIDSSAANGTSFVALKDCEVKITCSAYGSAVANIFITRNATSLVPGGVNGVVQVMTTSAASTGGIVTASILAKFGDIIRIQRNGSNLTNIEYVTLTATADNNATASPTQQVSSDTMSFAFKATAINGNDAIGTFNTYTYAANGNVATISATAPTQTVASMNVNGIQVFARAYNAASTTASPARVDVFIGKGLKSRQVDAYGDLAKQTAITYSNTASSSANENYDTTLSYDELTGILTINAATSPSAVTLRRVGVRLSDYLTYTSAYFTINASKSPSLVTIPNLQQRIAYLSDVKASGTAGGSSVAGTQTRTLNTIVDSTGIVTSLVSNQFILSAGTYYVEASTPGYKCNRHKCRIRNITDTTTPLLGTSEYCESTDNTGNRSFLFGEIVITSAKTFELQEYTEAAQASNGQGLPSSTGENEVYAQVKITRIK